MHARVATLQVQPGKMDELNAIFQDDVVPTVKQVAGFRSLTLLVDRKTSRAMMISVWETEAALKETEVNGFFQAQMLKFAPTIIGAPIREAYEVGAQS
jgi:quinol monooxygenase YgiN